MAQSQETTVRDEALAHLRSGATALAEGRVEQAAEDLVYAESIFRQINDVEHAAESRATLGEVRLICNGFVVGPQPGKPYLSRGQPRGCEADGGILPGVKAVLHDGNEPGCIAVLIGECELAVLVAVKGKEGDRRVFGDGLTSILECKITGDERRTCGAHYLA